MEPKKRKHVSTSEATSLPDRITRVEDFLKDVNATLGPIPVRKPKKLTSKAIRKGEGRSYINARKGLTTVESKVRTLEHTVLLQAREIRVMKSKINRMMTLLKNNSDNIIQTVCNHVSDSEESDEAKV